MWIKQIFKPIPQSSQTSIALFLIRSVVGLAFVFHGWGKIQNPFGWMGEDSTIPSILQFLAALSEFGGGIGLILGLLTKLCSFGIGCTMSYAVYLHLMILKDPFVSKGGGSYELALVYLTIATLFFLLGPGKFSLDQKVFKK